MRKAETANNRIHSAHQTLSHSFCQAKEDIPGAFATAQLAFGAGDAGRRRRKINMDTQTVIQIGGFYNLAFLVFHAMFWKIFKWHNELPKLTHINGAIMQVLNLCLMFCFLLFGYISLFHTSELGTSNMGRDLLLFIALFWLARAIEQLVFFSFKRSASIAMTILFLLGFCFYAYPLIRI